ncbi:MAG: 2-hydroxychromene-2-carboxylate isomerase [Porticoccaceae bacterium]|nr:2-hydroxychromene-2-carboxylate isomerase [Porticoccaceae bacterium]
MSEQFKEQGGAATMDPSARMRWLTSMFMNRVVSTKRLEKKRIKAEKHRQANNQPHVVEYFHQVDDGYSHLAAQALGALTERYNIDLQCHLVSGPIGENAPEPDLLIDLSRYDASKIAPYYGLVFPQNLDAPSAKLLEMTKSILAGFSSQDFVTHTATVGNALWSGSETVLQALAEQFGSTTDSEVKAKHDLGNARRGSLKHYSGAMFYYGGEWYWGVDRLYHLEQRLHALGADRSPDTPKIMPKQEVSVGKLRDNGSLTLELFGSVRSPYTAIVFDRVLALAETTGVTLNVRPILPMVMRGVSATREKGIYIFTDAAREARASNVPYGDFYDPIGEPARRCYSLYPWACSQGKGNALLSSFLSAAFAKGINTNNDRGLRQVVENAGLDWASAKQIVGQDGWQEILEDNRLAMYDSGLWGAPSFRLLDADKNVVLALWGQDRLWLFEREIQNLLA